MKANFFKSILQNGISRNTGKCKLGELAQSHNVEDGCVLTILFLICIPH